MTTQDVEYYSGRSLARQSLATLRFVAGGEALCGTGGQVLAYCSELAWSIAHHHGALWLNAAGLLLYTPIAVCSLVLGVPSAWFLIHGEAGELKAAASATRLVAHLESRPRWFVLRQWMALAVAVIFGLDFCLVGLALGTYLAWQMAHAHPTGFLSFDKALGLYYLWIAVFAVGGALFADAPNESRLRGVVKRLMRRA